MRIGVPKEVHAGEKRVATVPEVAEKLIKLGFSVTVETGAGEGAQFSDDAYREAGCDIAGSAELLWQQADIILKVRGPQPSEVIRCAKAPAWSASCGRPRIRNSLKR